jgi:protein TonB
MSRPFTLPVVIACSAHALLMFGFTKSPPPSTPPKPIEKGERWMTVCVPPEEIEKPDTIASLEKQSGGKPAAPMPISEDRSFDKISVGDILMEITRSDAVRVKVDTKVISPGDASGMNPNATEYGPGAGSEKIIYSAIGLDNPPRTRSQTPPSYPFALKTSGVSGEVLVEFVVDEHGRVVHPRVVRSTHSEFEAPTLAAVSKWRFEPGTRNMAPVRFRMVVPVKFNLNE